MAKAPLPNADDAAEKAYAAAAEAAPVEFPSKAKRARKPTDEAPVAAPAELAEIETAPEPEPEPAPVVGLTAPVAPKAKPRSRATAPKARPVKIAPKLAAPKPVAARKPAPLPTAKPKTAPVKTPVISQLKDTTMASKTTDFISDVKTKAKAVFDKGTSSIGEATDFAKGNVEAVVESGKIYAAGLKDLGSTYVAEGKTAFETITADAKELAAQKTPVDFFKLQSELAKKNFESAVAFGTKSSEAWLKLAGDAFAPLSGRVTLAVDKIKTPA